MNVTRTDDTHVAHSDPQSRDLPMKMGPPQNDVPVATLDERIRAFARERPITCVVGAVVLGFFVGKLAARF